MCPLRCNRIVVDWRVTMRKTYVITRNELGLLAVIFFLLVYSTGATWQWLSEKERAELYSQFMEHPVPLPHHHSITNFP